MELPCRSEKTMPLLPSSPIGLLKGRTPRNGSHPGDAGRRTKLEPGASQRKNWSPGKRVSSHGSDNSSEQLVGEMTQ